MSESEQMRAKKIPRRREGALSGVLWLGSGQVVGQAIHLSSRLLLARLLLPEDFGLIAMATVVIVFQDLVTAIGIPQALVQAKAIDETTKSSAFWAMLLQAALVAALTCLSAPACAALFGEPQLVGVIVALAVGGAILAPVALIESLLMREMIFRTVALRRALGKLAGGVAAVSLALLGYGVWSLVAGRLATSLISLLLVAKAAAWRPRFVFSVPALRSLAKFGGGVVFAGVISTATKQLPTLVVGKWLGSTEVGYLSLAQQVVLLPLTYVARPVVGVLFSVFSRLQDKRAEFAAVFQRWQFAVVAVAGLLPPLAALVAPVVVPGVLGEQWGPAVFIFQVLAVPATAQLVVAIVAAALRGLGQIRAVAGWMVFGFAVQAAGLAVGVRWGLEGAVVGWSLSSIASLLYGAVLAARALDRSVLTVLKPLGVTAPSIAGALGLGHLMLTHIDASPLLGAAAAVVVGVVAYGAILFVVAPAERDWVRQWLAKRRSIK